MCKKKTSAFQKRSDSVQNTPSVNTVIFKCNLLSHASLTHIPVVHHIKHLIKREQQKKAKNIAVSTV